MHRRARFAALAAVLSLFVTACATPTRAPSAAHAASSPAAAPGARSEPAPLLLVSIDGFRADYLDRGYAPQLARWAAEGVRAKWMTPSYPSLTFPNHYTLVTGLRPDRHGIVHNTMWDGELGDFALSRREAVGHSAW